MDRTVRRIVCEMRSVSIADSNQIAFRAGFARFALYVSKVRDLFKNDFDEKYV